MIFNSALHREEFLNSFGIKEGDKVKIIANNSEHSNSQGTVMELKLWFTNEPIYLIKLDDATNTSYKDNRFLRDHIELISVN